MSDGTLVFNTKLDSDGVTTGMTRIGSAASTALGTLAGNLMTQAVGGLRNLGSEAINAFGNIQQSFGGLDTIYKEASSSAKAYALQAQKMGISMNTYAEQAVSMGAALKQSLKGDIAAAAEKANLAISDMADNSAKMGTSIESLQNAYQGFAKGNYTMLDNLKLGFGGTKEEMERLLETAEKMPEAMGRKFDISSYADIVDAIHIVQENMGVAGVAAEEAQTTIQGSMNAAKASFENLLVAMGDPDGDVDTAMQTFLASLNTAWNNLAPTIQTIGKNILKQIGKGIETQLQPFKEDFVGTVSKIVKSIGEFISEVAGDNEVLNGIADAIKFLGENMDKVLPAVGGLTAAILTFNVALSIQSAIQGVVAAFKAFQAANEGATVAQWLLNAAMSANPIAIVVALIAGLVAAITILWNTNEGFRNGVLNIWRTVVDFFTKTIPSAFTTVINWFKAVPSAMLSLGADIVNGLIGGIKNAWSGLTSMIGNLVGGFVKGVKNMLGIHSPSRVFKYIGEMCVAGFEEGTEDLMNLDDIGANVSASWGTMSANMSGGMSRNTTFNFYDTQTSPDAIMRKAENTFQFGLAGGI